METVTGALYVVATPIGNLQDISARAVAVLTQVARIAVEDTRHSKKLLARYGVTTPLAILHEHNEREVTAALLKTLGAGEDIALISDAGTPLISDPGYILVRAARAAGIRVVPVPGASACIAALSASGLPTDRFVFEGFLPARQSPRRQRLETLVDEPRTLVFYESSHRIVAALADMAGILGAGRAAVIARELTKLFETIEDGTLADLLEWLQQDSKRQKGEFVVMVHGNTVHAHSELDRDSRHTLKVLLEELPLKQAVSLAARITGFSRNHLYAYGLELKSQRND